MHRPPIRPVRIRLTSDQIGGFVHHIAVNSAGHISGDQIQATDVASDKTGPCRRGDAPCGWKKLPEANARNLCRERDFSGDCGN